MISCLRCHFSSPLTNSKRLFLKLYRHGKYAIVYYFSNGEFINCITQFEGWHFTNKNLKVCSLRIIYNKSRTKWRRKTYFSIFFPQAIELSHFLYLSSTLKEKKVEKSDKGKKDKNSFASFILCQRPGIMIRSIVLRGEQADLQYYWPHWVLRREQADL